MLKFLTDLEYGYAHDKNQDKDIKQDSQLDNWALLKHHGRSAEGDAIFKGQRSQHLCYRLASGDDQKESDQDVAEAHRPQQHGN